MHKHIKFIFLAISLFYFTGCGQGAQFNSANNKASSSSSSQDSNNGNSINIGDNDTDLGTIEASCQNSKRYSTMVSVQFDRPQNTCDWGANGNLNERNGHFQARIEQKKNLNLPAGAIICDASFSFAQQNFLYDDHFLLMFNKSVIAASYDFRSRLNEGVNGLLQYNWGQLAGMKWDHSKETIFCPNIPGAQSDCAFPGHDQQGTIQLAYDPLYIKSIMASGVPENHSFTIVTVGDNDNLDCEHSDVNFSVMVEYVMPK